MKLVFNINNVEDVRLANLENTKLNLIFFFLALHLAWHNTKYQKVDVYCDDFYYKIFEKLNVLNWFNTIKHENVNFDNQKIWHGKMLSIYDSFLKKEPFCFIDNDCFIFKPIQLNGDCGVFAIENNLHYRLLESYAYKLKPPAGKEYQNCYNTGIMYFNKINDHIIKCYKENTIDFISQNRHFEVYDLVVMDQFLFFNELLVHNHVDKVEYFYSKEHFDNWSQQWKVGIAHLFGGYSKRNAKTCFHVGRHLERFNKELYHKILNLK